MALSANQAVVQTGVADLLISLARHEGSASHPYASSRISAGVHAARDFADAVHYFCTLYGRHPGVVDLAAGRATPLVAADWAAAAVEGFARERAYLTHLVVAAGPLPSTPGQAESEAAVIGQRHALEMLASSDRAGCALGAAMALILDWRAVRTVLDAAARRFSIEAPLCVLPRADETARVAAVVADQPRVERALTFGAQQLLVQQRALWDLLSARRQAREHH